jgi:diguanylate cyclase (GGDEF)-like protein/PAS domain S-box-containing protein
MQTCGPSTDETSAAIEESVEDLYENAPCSLLSTLPNGPIIKVNRTFLSWIGYERDEVVGKKRFRDFLTPAGRIFYETKLGPLLYLQGTVEEVALEIVCKDRSRLRVFFSAVQKKDADGQLLISRIILFHASARRQYEEELLAARNNAELASASLSKLNSQMAQTNAALHEQGERLRVTLNSIGDGVIATDTGGSITYMNPVAARLTGWDEQDAIGLPLPEVFHVIDDASGNRAPNPVDLVLRGEQAHGFEYMTLIRRSGERVSVKDSVAPIRDKQNLIIGVVLVIRDISHAREMSARIAWQATHDALTGLINRREFIRRLELALQSAQGDDARHSVLYIDLDQFKIINDTCGHGAGDELLGQLCAIMRAQLRQSDTLARLGGDEFGVLLEHCSGEDAMSIADMLRQTVKGFHFAWANKVFPLGVSIGVVLLGNDGATPVDVLRMADSACYVAKDMGRNRIHLYAQDDRELEKREGEMSWVGKIQKALNDQRFELYSQKILALKEDEGEHYEVLLRLRDEAGNLVAPMAFIPAAERYGLMPELDRWVITTALSHYSTRHHQSDQGGLCAINLSGTTICDDGFLGFLKSEFKRHGVSPTRICFEITETAAISNLSQAAALIGELKAMGCRIALDDFGSGMSSFAYLKHLPVDYLKIDGDFVRDIVNDPIDRAMTESINHIGHVMGIRTIAEFVENDVILNELRRIGVDFAQGYGVQKPVPMVVALKDRSH